MVVVQAGENELKITPAAHIGDTDDPDTVWESREMYVYVSNGSVLDLPYQEWFVFENTSKTIDAIIYIS